MKIKLLLLSMLSIIGVLYFTGCSNNSNTPESVQKEDTKDNLNELSEEAESIVNIVDLEQDEIAFSHDDYFFSEDLELEVYSKQPCKIYYTTDGTDPSEEKKLYEKAIKIAANNSVEATCIKAKGFFEDGTQSATIVHTFFVGNDVKTRFDTLVFSVTTDPYNLYDDEYGIFVEGKLRKDWIKENPDDKIEPNDPANFNMRGRESEREVFLEIVEADGTAIARQKAGIRTYGGWSRAREQKSIKMYARKEYDKENNKFRYEFFPQKTAANGDGSVLDSFKQLVLRNCGNDNGFAFIRDELFQTLAGQAGYQDYEAVRPAALFVNGDYRGFFWLHEVYGDEYFEDNYGDYQGSFEILEGGDTYKEIDEDGENEEFAMEYMNIYDTYAKMDLTDNINYEKLKGLIDIENYLAYFALQIYIGNEDWPHNNYKTYRYYAAAGEKYREAPFDGKWRNLLHDLDFSTGIYDTGAFVDNIDKYIGQNGEVRDTCPLFGQLMNREDCKEIFIKQTVDLINGAFAPNNLRSVMDEMHASRWKELNHTYGKGLLEDWVQPDQLVYRMGVLNDYAEQRASHILTKYKEYFGLEAIYKLKVAPAEGATIKVNTFATEDYFEGSYYTDYETTITTVLPKGTKFDYWLVNGEKVEEEELIITPSKIKEGVVEVNCRVK